MYKKKKKDSQMFYFSQKLQKLQPLLRYLSTFVDKPLPPPPSPLARHVAFARRGIIETYLSR